MIIHLKDPIKKKGKITNTLNFRKEKSSKIAIKLIYFYMDSDMFQSLYTAKNS